VAGKRLLLAVSGVAAPVSRQEGWAQFEVKSIPDHEIAVLE
jgi:hypothetical protein